MIDSFRGEYRFLSNFYIEPDRTCVECEFQQAKVYPALIPNFLLLTPAEAKKLGRSVELRPDWEFVKKKIMYDLIKKKFTDHSILKYLLLQTGTNELIEGNTWGDTYWGICNGKGSNHLGRILMQVRGELG